MQIKYRDVEKEKQLLALLLKSRRANKADILAKLDATTFSTLTTRQLFLLIRDYHYKYFAPINFNIAISQADELDVEPGHRRKLKRLIKKLKSTEVSARMLDYLMEELLICEHSRDIQQLLVSAKDIFKESANPFMVRDYISDALAKAHSREHHETEVLDLRGDFSERFRAIKKARKEGQLIRGIESGIDARFDDQTCGYCPGDLIVFVAQTSGGKSITMQDQAIYITVELNKKVAYITNEMTARQVAYRMDARISQIRHNKFKKPPLMRKVDLLKWKTTIKELHKNKIKIIGMHENCSMAAIDAKLTEIGFKPDLIFIDYVQNMVPSSRANRDIISVDWQPQAVIVKEGKNLALKRKVPIITAGQLKPEAEGKEEIEIRDIAISKQALSNNADCLFAIIQTKAMKIRNPPRAKIQFLKIREGKTREFIEVIPNFGMIRLNDPKRKKRKKKRNKK